MNAKVIIVVGFVVAIGGILYFTQMRPGSGGGQAGANAAGGTTSAASGSVTEISMIYSTEKKDWIEACAAGFRKEHPEINVKLIGKGSLESGQAIVDGKDQPTLWSPADSLIMRMYESDWRTAKGTDLFATAGEDAPQPLVLSPLVFAIWADRADVLLSSGGGKLTWRSIHDAVTSNQGWPKIGGKPDWGFVRLGHTDPTRSNSGVQALFSMTFEYYNKSNGVTVGDILEPKYQKFISEIEKGVAKFEASTGTFMTDMIRFGPSKYDIAVVYESLAISQLENAQGRWGNLRIYYPSVTLWSDHPVALLNGDWIKPEQKKAAKLWIDYLRSRPMQQRALAFGFRPADTSVPIKTAEASTNPFMRLAEFGVSLDIPPAAQTPEGTVVRNLLTMWARLPKSQ